MRGEGYSNSPISPVRNSTFFGQRTGCVPWLRFLCGTQDLRELARVRGEFVDVGGTRLYYYAAGTRGGGAPVVFLHGFPGSGHGWRLLAPLMPEGRRLVVVDLMGCGRSDGPCGGADTVLVHAGLIQGLIDELAIAKAAIVGHGIGGTIATAVALGRPERVAALALLGTIAFDARPRALGRMARMAAPAARLLGGSVLASFLHGSALRGYADREAGRRSLDQSLNGYATRLGADSLVSHLTLDHDPAIMALGGRLGEVRAPTAVVWGSDDPFLDVSVGERLKSAIPGATLDVIPGARHFVAEDAPERCAEVICRLLAESPES